MTTVRVAALLFLLFFIDACAAVVTPQHVEFIPSDPWTTYGVENGGVATVRTIGEQATSNVTDDMLLQTVQRNGNSNGGSRFKLYLVNEPKHLHVRPAIELAISIMEHAWSSSVQVRTRIEFKDLGGSNVLAQGGGTLFCRIKTLFQELVPIAAGKALLGRDLNKDEPGKRKYDVLITINSRGAWYVETDARPPSNQYDLTTVVLHEIYHNLLFTGGIFVKENNIAYYEKDKLTRFDAFLANRDGCSILGYVYDEKLIAKTGKSGKQLLAESVVNERLYFGYESLGELVQLNAPRVYQPKSSIYHLDDSINGHDALMSPRLRQGEANHQIGPKTRAIQRLYLNPDVRGASIHCPSPLRDPAPRPITPDDRGVQHDPHPDKGPIGSNPIEYNPTPFPIAWIIVLSILAILLLLTICALLACFAIKLAKKESGTSSSSSEGNVFQPVPADPGYHTPSRSKTSSYEPGYPPEPPPQPPTVLPPPPVYPRTASGRRSSSGRYPSVRPPSTAHPSTRPSSGRHGGSSRHSSKKPPSCKPSHRSHRSSRAPTTENYFDCS